MYSAAQDRVALTVPILEAAIDATISHSAIRNDINRKWITPETLICAIQATGTIVPEIDLDAPVVNRLLARSKRFGCMDIYDGSNNVGLFKFPYSRKTFYQVVDPGVQVAYPVINGQIFKIFVKKVEEDSEKMLQLQSKRQTRSSTTEDVPASGATNISNNNVEAASIAPMPPTKRQKVLLETYWDSEEARKLFQPSR